MRPSFFHHLHPPTIPARQSRLRYTLGAGGFSVFLCLVLAVTGALEMFYYSPTPQEAGATIQVITYLVPYGSIVRNLHFWAAQFLVVISALHMLRVIFTGAFTLPRRFNYLLGLSLFILVLFLNFTGYILRWDEGVRWALVAGTNLVKSIPVIGLNLYYFVIGGAQPGGATLTRFYAWHIFGLTLLMVILGSWHIFRLRRDGGIAAPPPELRQERERINRFELARRESLAAIIMTAILLLVAAFLPAPLEAPMTEFSSAGADSKAPWFFLWVQQLLKLGDAFWMGVAVPLGVIALLALLPYIFPRTPDAELGEWFPPSGRAVQILVGLISIAIIGLTIFAMVAV